MASHIPFVNSKTDCDYLTKYYVDADRIRVSLESYPKLKDSIPSSMQLWIDPSMDGFHRDPLQRNEQWSIYISKFENWKEFDSEAFRKKPDAKKVRKFVFAILDACARHSPSWISVPQFPLGDASRNSINRCLATATNQWYVEKNFKGKLILPAIITEQEHANSKTERNKKIEAIESCYNRATAHGIWVVDSSLSDQTGSPTFQKVRFPGLISFHDELSKKIENAVFVGGPYWGLNLVLWSRTLIHHPAIGMGNGYQYHIAGGIITGAAKTRIALGPLRRWVVTGPDLKTWLQNAQLALPTASTLQTYFKNLSVNFSLYQDKATARTQVAKFYKEWFDKIEAAPETGRALALYQDLSTSYVLGKSLPDLPKDEAPATKPARIAEYLMLNCL